MTKPGAPGPEEWVRLLLAAYPREFRRRFGAGLRYALLRDHRQAQERGRMAAAAFWVRTSVSVLLNGFIERSRERRRDVGVQAWSRTSRRPGPGREGVEMGVLAREIGFAWRRLVRRPGFSLTAVGTLALGIGATTAIFAVVNGVILRPLPYPDPGRLVRVGHVSPSDRMAMPDGGYLHYAEHASTLQSLSAYLESSATISGTGEPLEVGIIQATPSLLPTLGVAPARGRWFTEEDAREGAPPVTVVSHGYWQRQLGGDPEAVGEPVLEGARQIVVGILPEGFAFPRPDATVVFGNPFESPDIYLPLRMDRSRARFGNFMYQAVGRLAPAATRETAERELTALMPAAAEAFPNPGGYTREELLESGIEVRVSTVRDAIVGDFARVLWIVMGGVALVLLVATANVANLFLVRAEARRGEIAVRRALGAGRGALVRSFLSESVLLGALGGALGVFLAWGAVRTLLRFAPGDLPRLDEVAVDPTVTAFAAGLSVLVALVFGIAPLIRALRFQVGTELQDRPRGDTGGRSRRRGQQLLVTGQVALALVLLAAGGLLLRTFRNLRSVDPGFDPAHVLTLKLSLGENLVRGAGYEGADDAVRSRFMLDLTRRLEEIPGVESGAFTADLPLDEGTHYDYVAVDGPDFPADMSEATRALRVFVGPGYLETIGARFRAGEDLASLEFQDQPRSVVVNRSFAEQRWPGEQPLGKRLLQYWPGVDREADVWYTVTGVVEDLHEVSLMSPPQPTVYLPTIFLPEGDFAMWVSNMAAVLRTSGDPRAVLPAVRAAIREFHPEVPVTDIRTLDGLTARSYQEVTFAMVLLLLAGAVAVALGVVGIYGTVAYVVGQRTREFGLRMALGASGRDIRWSVLRGAGVVGATGVAVGVLGALGTGRLLESLLFGVAAADPAVIALVAVGLFAVVVTASLTPAARAAAVDPVEAMRVE